MSKRILILCFVAIITCALQAADTCTPLKKNSGAGSLTRTTAAYAGKKVNIVWIGDSITWAWGVSKDHKYTGGKEVWNKYFAKYEPSINIGVSGDAIEHVLWRITEGKQLDGYKAEVVVLMLGINNLLGGIRRDRGRADAVADEVVIGMENMINVIRRKQPKAHIILMSLLPSDWTGGNYIDPVNERYKKLAEGKRITWFDLNKAFKDKNGKLRVELTRDKLHPNPAGYEIWAKEISPLLKKLLKK